MDKRVVLALECEDAKEYQLVARAFFLVLDVVGEGLPPASPQHHAMLSLFRQEWCNLPMEQRMRCVNRMAIALKAGAVLEAAEPDLSEMADEVIRVHTKNTQAGRRN